MILGRVGVQTNEDFTVADSSNMLVSGIDSTSFSYHIFDSTGSEVSGSITVDFTELGYGHYRASFIPNIIGMWYLVVYHSTYFPWGKSGSVQVFSNDFDSITVLLTRALGLMQENFFMDQCIYDEQHNLTNARIRIYDNESNVGSETGIISTYIVNATYSSNNLESYRVRRG